MILYIQSQPKGRRLRLFQFFGLLIVPVLLLSGLEVGLRTFDYSVPTGFTYEQKVDGETRILSNPYYRNIEETKAGKQHSQLTDRTNGPSFCWTKGQFYEMLSSFRWRQ